MGRLGPNASAVGLGDASLALLRDLIEDRAGVWFDDAKMPLLADKLSELVTAHDLPSLLDYYFLLRYDADAPRHWVKLMDRLAVPETYFWRQADQFETLARNVAPAHFARAAGRPLRVWSAACCTGEEPVSIAIALAEAGLLADEQVQIVASDASEAMLERARAARYRDRAFRQLPRPLFEKYFEPAGEGTWSPNACLLNHITYHRANLLDPAEWVAFGSADAVFCRNVFIYFSDMAIRKVCTALASRMPPGSHLFLGASESLTRFGLAFDLMEIGRSFVYVRSSR